MLISVRVLLHTILLLLASGASAQSRKEERRLFWNDSLIQGREHYLNTPSEISHTGQRPNIILILADDLGARDLSLYGCERFTTPNLDAIGREGVTFTEAYITSPVCSPSRAGLLTGRYQQRFGHELQPAERYVQNVFAYLALTLLPKYRVLQANWLKSATPSDEDRMRQGLPPSEITLAEVLKKSGYQTAIIGKWHLGAADFALPCKRGFDYQYGFSEAYTLYADPDDPSILNARDKGPAKFMDAHQWKEAQGRNGNCAITRNCCEPVEDPKYLTDKLTDEAIGFMERCGDQPFFLYLPYNAPHAPLQAKREFLPDAWKQAHGNIPTSVAYDAVIRSLDDQVGRLMNYLDDRNISSNTLVFFLSDNGGAAYNGSTTNAPYRGGKITNFEGGIRVPFMLRWDKHITPGLVYPHPVSSLDVFMTACQAAHADLPADREYDGLDLLQAIARPESAAHPFLFWRSAENAAVRSSEGWKLILNDRSGETSLFDLRADISESHDRSRDYPAKVEELRSQLKTWEAEMVAPLWPNAVRFIYTEKNNKSGKRVFSF